MAKDISSLGILRGESLCLHQWVVISKCRLTALPEGFSELKLNLNLHLELVSCNLTENIRGKWIVGTATGVSDWSLLLPKHSWCWFSSVGRFILRKLGRGYVSFRECLFIPIVCFRPWGVTDWKGVRIHCLTNFELF